MEDMVHRGAADLEEETGAAEETIETLQQEETGGPPHTHSHTHTGPEGTRWYR